MCRLFSHSLSPLLGVGGLGGGIFFFGGLLDICVCLHAHVGSSNADVRLVVAVFAFSPQPSAAGKSLCLSVLSVWGAKTLDLHAPDLQYDSSKRKKKYFASQSVHLRSL